MPTYQFKHKVTGEIVEKIMKISELDSFKQENSDLHQVILSAPLTADPTRMSATNISKGDPVFQKYIIGRMKEAIPGNTLSDRKFQIPKEY